MFGWAQLASGAMKLFNTLAAMFHDAEVKQSGKTEQQRDDLLTLEDRARRADTAGADASVLPTEKRFRD